MSIIITLVGNEKGMSIKRTLIGLGILISVGFVSLIYKIYNPMLYSFFPPCPIKHITGLDCPTCGTQRALHLFLNGEFKAAFLQNPLVFIITPYFFLWIYLKLNNKPTPNELKLYSKLYGNKALTALVTIVVIFTICRNIL